MLCGDGCLHERAGRRGEAGGAVTLCVVLLVPVSMLAVIAAAAVPQRLAAQTALHDAAYDIAAVASSRGVARDPVAGLTLDPVCGAGQGTLSVPEVETLTAVCAVVRSLGTAGFETETLRGFYTNTLQADVHTPGAATTAVSDSAVHLWHLCEAGAATVNAEVVYASVAGDWTQAGWAAAQVWPDGQRLAAEALALRDPAAVSQGPNGGRCEPAHSAINRGLVTTAAAAGDPVVRHRLRAKR